MLKKIHVFLRKRQQFVKEAFKNEPKVKVVTYKGLTIDFCKEIDAQFILRGLRNPADFEFEKAIAHTNRKLSKIETVFYSPQQKLRISHRPLYVML